MSTPSGEILPPFSLGERHTAQVRYPFGEGRVPHHSFVRPSDRLRAIA